MTCKSSNGPCWTKRWTYCWTFFDGDSGRNIAAVAQRLSSRNQRRAEAAASFRGLGERRTDEFCKEIKQLTSSPPVRVGRNVGRLVGRFDRGNAVPRCVKSRYGKRRMRARAHCPSSVE